METPSATLVSGDRRLPLLRGILQSATAGKVRLCLDPAELPTPLAEVGPTFTIGRDTLVEFRRVVYEFAARHGFPADRRQQLLTAAGEAAMNAVRHGRGGEAALYACDRKTVQVWIRDQGGDPAAADREAGESRGGYGWWLTVRAADRVWLYPDPDDGTVVVIEQERTPPDAALGGSGDAPSTAD
jgi:anti-sigma regulatory factor (Ser/Thr protein kinase)